MQRLLSWRSNGNSPIKQNSGGRKRTQTTSLFDDEQQLSSIPLSCTLTSVTVTTNRKGGNSNTKVKANNTNSQKNHQNVGRMSGTASTMTSSNNALVVASSTSNSNSNKKSYGRRNSKHKQAAAEEAAAARQRRKQQSSAGCWIGLFATSEYCLLNKELSMMETRFVTHLCWF